MSVSICCIYNNIAMLFGSLEIDRLHRCQGTGVLVWS